MRRFKPACVLVLVAVGLLQESMKTTGEQVVRVKSNDSATLSYDVEEPLNTTASTLSGNKNRIEIDLKFSNVSREDDETDECMRITGGRVVRVKLKHSATLSCYIKRNPKGFPMHTSWVKISSFRNKKPWNTTSTTFLKKRNRIKIRLKISNVSRKDNGTYQCIVEDKNCNRTIHGQTYLIVTEVPTVRIDIVKPVGVESVYLSWTVDHGTYPVKMYLLQQREKNVNKWSNISHEVNSKSLSCIIEKLKRNSTYEFRIIATNSIGDSKPAKTKPITTLEKDPEYQSNFFIVSISDTSVTIRLFSSPGELKDDVHYYKINANHTNHTKEYSDVIDHLFILEELETGEKYHIKAAACSKYTNRCSKWSKEKYVLVKEDIEYHPNVTVGEVTVNSIGIKWSVPPPELRDRFVHYEVYAYNCTDGKWIRDYVKRNSSYVFKNLQPDTTYSIYVIVVDGYRQRCIEGSPSVFRERTLAIDKESSKYTVLVVSLIIAILLFIMMVIWSRIQRRRDLAARRRFIEAAIETFKSGDRCSVDPELAMAEQAELLPYNKKWEFPKKLLKFDKVLGSGAFGIVRKAVAESICKRQKYSTVAVKMVRATHRLDHMMALQRELKILAHLGKHINVVNLLGACTRRISYGELLVIVEFCRFGNLHDYLLRSRADFVDQVVIDDGTIAGPSFRIDSANAIDSGIITADFSRDPNLNDTSDEVEEPDTGDDLQSVVLDGVINYEGDFSDLDLEPIGTRDLLCWAWQVSRGMNYLSSKKVLHGDLAARNILLADNNVVKICDFGLAKSLYASDIYKKEGNGPLPVKWMAIESIGDRVFSVKSDVWSFGVVLWEFFTLAETPYPGIANESVYTKLIDGFRMERPKYATEDIYRMMLSCWDAEPSKRPSFRELEDIIDDYLDGRSKEHYLHFDDAYEKINAETSASEGVDYLTMSPSEYASSGTAETTV